MTADSVRDARSRRGWIAAGSIAFLALGLVWGAVLAFWQAARLSVGPVSVPWGAVAAVVLLVAIIRLATNGLRTRWAGSSVFTGWLLATIAFATETVWSGDLIISSGTRQVVYLLAGVVAGSAAASIKARPALSVRSSDATATA